MLIFRGALSLKPMTAVATTWTHLLPRFWECSRVAICATRASIIHHFVLCISLLYCKVDPTCMARPSFASIFKHCAGNKVDVTTIYLGFFSNCDACPPWRMQPNRQSHPTFRTPPTWGTGDPPFFRPTRLEVALESNHAADPWPFQWGWMTGSR